VNLNRLWAITIKLQTHEEEVMISGFVQGMMTRPLCYSAEKRRKSRYVPCVAKKDETKMMAREESTAWPRF